MQLEFYDSLGQPQCVPARRVVLRTDHGMIVAAAMEYQPGLVTVAAYNDPALERLLHVMGIEQTQVQIVEASLQPLENTPLRI